MGALHRPSCFAYTHRLYANYRSPGSIKRIRREAKRVVPYFRTVVSMWCPREGCKIAKRQNCQREHTQVSRDGNGIDMSVFEDVFSLAFCLLHEPQLCILSVQLALRYITPSRLYSGVSTLLEPLCLGVAFWLVLRTPETSYPQ